MPGLRADHRPLSPAERAVVRDAERTIRAAVCGLALLGLHTGRPEAATLVAAVRRELRRVCGLLSRLEGASIDEGASW